MATPQAQLTAQQLVNLLSGIKVWGFLHDSQINNSLYMCKCMHMQTTGRKNYQQLSSECLPFKKDLIKFPAFKAQKSSTWGEWFSKSCKKQ